MKAPATAARPGELTARLQARRIVTAAANWSAAQRADLGSAAPERLAQPENADALREVIVEAGVAESPLLVLGGGTALASGAPRTRADLAVSMRGLARIVEHAAADFVVTVEAGCRLADLQRELAAQRQWVAIEPPDPERATIGGLIASAATSLVATGHGTLRNHLLGLRVLHADGRFAKAGGRVVKNVAGYDLMKMHHGALGTLGVVVAATLRLRPLPAADLVAWTPIVDHDSIVACADALAQPGFAPAGLHFLGPIGPLGSGRLTGDLVVRFQGARAAVLDQLATLSARLADRLGAWRREVLEPAEGFPRPRPLQELEQACARGDDPQTAIASLHFRPSRLGQLLAVLANLGGGQVALELARGTGWLKLPVPAIGGAAGTRGAGSASEPLLAALKVTRTQIEAMDGAIVLHAGPPALRAILPDSIAREGATRLAAALRHELDPAGRFDQGRFGRHGEHGKSGATP